MADNEKYQNNKEYQAILKKYGNNFVSIIAKELLKSGKNASGKLIKSLKAELKPVAETINIVIKSEDYLKYVDEGRKPGSYPPISALSKWVRIKNIPQSAVFAIAKNIFKFGIKPTNVISKATNIFTSKELKPMEKEISDFVEREVTKILKRKK